MGTPALNIDRIQRFYQYTHPSPTVESPYLVFEPDGAYSYVAALQPRAIKMVAERIKGTGWKKRLGWATLRAGSTAPRSLRLLPFVNKRMFSVPIDDPFDMAIVRNRRAKLVHVASEKVYTIPIADQGGIIDEYWTRSKLPASIPVPEIVDVDLSQPYIAERYIHGRTLRGPVEQYDHFFDAIRSLKPLYESFDPEKRATRYILKEAEERLLDSAGIRDTDVRRYRAFVESHALPEQLIESRIHGDFHTGNILRSENGEIYILDWESSRRDCIVFDLFNSFSKEYFDSNDPMLFRGMVTDSGIGGCIMNRYTDELGSIAFEDKSTYGGLPLLYLFHQLSRLNLDRRLDDTDQYRLLDRLLETIGPT